MEIQLKPETEFKDPCNEVIILENNYDKDLYQEILMEVIRYHPGIVQEVAQILGYDMASIRKREEEYAEAELREPEFVHSRNCGLFPHESIGR